MLTISDAEIDRLVRGAVAEMQGKPGAEWANTATMTSNEAEREEEEEYFTQVAIPLGEVETRAGVFGSQLIAQDREP